jgi:hypothetical protein
MSGFKEEHLILRVPEHLADKLNALFDKDEDTEVIDITPQIRLKNGERLTQFDFQMGDFHSTASLVELPCVIETHKSLDDVNYFKTGNISQMIYVHPNNEEMLEQGGLISPEIRPVRGQVHSGGQPRQGDSQLLGEVRPDPTDSLHPPTVLPKGPANRSGRVPGSGAGSGRNFEGALNRISRMTGRKRQKRTKVGRQSLE